MFIVNLMHFVQVKCRQVLDDGPRVGGNSKKIGAGVQEGQNPFNHGLGDIGFHVGILITERA